MGAAELSGVSLAAPGARHELAVDFPDKAEGKREVAAADLGKPVVHGLDVVDDFLDVLGGALLAGLVVDDIFKCALGALDLRREDGLVADIHGHEEIGTGKDGANAIESAEGAVGIRQKADDLLILIERRFRGKWGRDEGRVAFTLFHKMA